MAEPNTMKNFHTIVPTPLGEALFVATQKGLAALAFAGTPEEAIESLRGRFDIGAHAPDSPLLQPCVEAVQWYLQGEPLPTGLPLDLRGTPFQLEVWQALLAIPAGETRSYGQIARALGRPSAARAVGAAVGANRLAVVVPCHRAVPATGGIGAFRWGRDRKRLLLEMEARPNFGSVGAGYSSEK